MLLFRNEIDNSRTNIPQSMNLPSIVKLLLILILTISVQSVYLQAQPNETFTVVDEAKDYESFHLKNGSVINGTSLFEDETSILLKLYSSSDTISLDKNLLLNVDSLGVVAFDHTIQENAGITPTAFNLKKGEQRYRNVYLLYNDYSRGITDKLSVTAGFALYPEAIFESELYVGLAARLKYSHRINENIGVAIAPTFYFDSYHSASISMLPAVVTIGKPSKFLNLGSTLFYDHYYGDFFNLISIGGGYSFSDKFSIVTENLISTADLWDSFITTSLMGKYLFKNKHQVQLGLNYFDGIPLPILSYAYFWNK